MLWAFTDLLQIFPAIPSRYSLTGESPTVAPIWASSIEIRNNYRLGIIQRSKYGEKITLELKDDGKTKKVERLIFGWS